MKLEEFETILADHGHKDVYYPKMIIKKKFKEMLMESLMDEIEKEFKDTLDYAKIKTRLRKNIKERIEKCFL